MTVAEPGKVFAIEDIANSKFEAYDSLAKVYGLYATISKDPVRGVRLRVEAADLKLEQKKELYSKFACHETASSSSKKDPEFLQDGGEAVPREQEGTRRSSITTCSTTT